MGQRLAAGVVFGPKGERGSALLHTFCETVSARNLSMRENHYDVFGEDTIEGFMASYHS